MVDGADNVVVGGGSLGDVKRDRGIASVALPPVANAGASSVGDAAEAVAVAAAQGDHKSRAAQKILDEIMLGKHNHSSVDRILSQELLKLSLEDRNAIQEEIHGVRCLAPEESPELLARSLKEFQNELDAIVSKESSGGADDSNKNSNDSNCVAVYNLILEARRREEEEEGTNGSTGIRRNHNYALDSPDFRLRFLRCELFRVDMAVRRFLRYLDFVHEGWGDVALRREIGVADFKTKDGKALLRKGYFQVLPFRDKSGRRILALLGGMNENVDPLERAKAMFYVYDVATRDSVESQRCGAVVISERKVFDRLYVNGSFTFTKRDIVLADAILASTPTRIVANHHCWPNTLGFRLMAKIIMHFSEPEKRLRLRIQLGDELELRYRLMTYGIPIELLPLTETGTIKTAYYKQWIKTRTFIEEKQNKVINGNGEVGTGQDDSIVVECPAFNDVVFRHGTSVLANPGNARFRDLIITYLEEKTEEKTERQWNTVSDLDFCAWLMDEIHLQRKGRFLDWDKKLKSWKKINSNDLIARKILNLIYNVASRKRSATLRRQQESRNRTNKGTPSALNHYDNVNEAGMAYRFLEDGRPSSQHCCSGNRKRMKKDPS